MTHGELQEMLGLHALRALDADDGATLAAHLDGCRDCVAELAELEAAAAELARMPGAIPPSAEVTRRILAVGERRQMAATSRQLGKARPARRWRLLRVAACVAGAAIVGLLLVSHVALQRRLDRASAMLARGRDMLEFMASPDVVTVSLAATGTTSAARALVSYDRRSGRVVVLAFDLSPPPPGRVYQLWRIAEGVRSGVVFSTDARGGTLLREQWLPGEADVPIFAVTLEPAPGVDAPTGQILLLGGASAPRPAIQN
jgi:hypothetical protein